jgi:arylsulfatase A-like enzyme
MTDQHRADHLGCYGNPIVKTPAIDAIAKEGCVFDAFHVATPLCQPNRASFMTGMMPSVHGVQMNGRALSFGLRTFVELLRDAGYQTGLVGKAHLQNITELPRAWPAADETPLATESRRPFPGDYDQEQWRRWEADPTFSLALPYYGFDTAALTIGHSDEQHGHWRRWLRTQTPDADALIGPENAIPTPDYALTKFRQAWRTRVPEALYPTRYIADQSVAFLESQAGSKQPFFLQCSFPDPHHPFTPPGRFWDMYDPESMPLPANFDARVSDPPPALLALRAQMQRGTARKAGHGSFATTEREMHEALALNFGNIACVDDGIARVMAALKRTGLDDNTVVIFTSDHGDLMGDHGLMLKGGLHYKSLTRVPFIWRDTRDLRHSDRSQSLGQTTDISATILERAAVSPVQGMQGASLLPHIQRQAPAPHEFLVIEEEGQRRDFEFSARVKMRSLITTQFRMTIYANHSDGELYDLQNDPDECVNLWNAPSAQATRAALTETLARAMMQSANSSPYPSAAA